MRDCPNNNRSQANWTLKKFFDWSKSQSIHTHSGRILILLTNQVFWYGQFHFYPYISIGIWIFLSQNYKYIFFILIIGNS
jgi:hypothetical protein